MPQTIDVTGLPPEAIRAMESLVGLMRKQAQPDPVPKKSIFDLIGKAPVLRFEEELLKQAREEREAWGEE